MFLFYVQTAVNRCYYSDVAISKSADTGCFQFPDDDVTNVFKNQLYGLTDAAT